MPTATTSDTSGWPLERLLLFELEGQAHALPLSALGGFAIGGAVRAVPRAPAAVVGLTEWRGSVLTVLDLPRLLGRSDGGGTTYIARLTGPLGRIGLRFHGAVHLVTARVPPGEADATAVTRSFPLDGATVALVHPARLIGSFDAASPARNA